MKIPVVLFSEDEENLANLGMHLDGARSVSQVKKVSKIQDASALLAEMQGPAVAVLDLSGNLESVFKFADDIKLEFRNVHIVMTGAQGSPDLLLGALRSGAEEFFTQPFDGSEISQSLERISNKIDVLAPANGKKAGKIITVFASKGGVGTTSVATNLAVALLGDGKTKKSVCVADLDLQFGSVSTVLHLDVSYTMLDLAKNLEGMDALSLEGSLAKHRSGVRVLPEPFYVEDASRIKAVHVERVLEMLVQSFDYVILDRSKSIDEVCMLAFEKSQMILLVMGMDIPSLQCTHKAIGLFDRAQIPQSKVRLVINKYAKNKAFNQDSIAKVLGIKPFWMLPDDEPLATTALNQGWSVGETKPGSGLAKSYRGLGQAVDKTLSVRLAEPEEAKGGLLGRLVANFV